MKKLVMPIVALAAACLLVHGAWAYEWQGNTSNDMSDPSNWTGSSGSYDIRKNAELTLTQNWSPSTAVQIKWQGITVVFDIDGKTLTSSNGFSYNIQPGTIVTNATVKFLNGTYDFGTKAFTPHIVDGLTTVISNATLSTTGNMLIQTSSQDNSSTGSTLSIIDGAKVSVGNAALHGVGNSMLVDGEETEFSTSAVFYIGRFAEQDGNSLDIINGATVNAGTGFIVGGTYNDDASKTSASNVVTVADGATLKVSGGSYGMIIGRNGDWNTLRVENGGIVTNATEASFIVGKVSSHNAVAVDGADSCLYSKSVWIGGSANASDNSLAVIDGAKCWGRVLKFTGSNNSLIVSNATVTFQYLYTTNDNVKVATTGTKLVFAGENANMTANNVNNAAASFTSSDILEFVVPAEGWATAPLTIKQAFSIPSGVTLRVDAASVKAWLKAHPEGGTVPLISTDSTSKAITIGDDAMAALQASLPSNCELVNASGVLSCRIKSPGLAIFVR